MDLKSYIRTIPDYPTQGVQFRDITTILEDSNAFRYCVDRLYQRYQNTAFDALAVIESRGFVFGSALAYLLHVPLLVIRKKGKLPGKTISANYKLEYGTSSLEVHVDALEDSDRVILIDDLIATGGTVCAAAELIRKLGGDPVECAVVIELVDLNGRENIAPLPLFSLVTFHEDET